MYFTQDKLKKLIIEEFDNLQELEFDEGILEENLLNEVNKKDIAAFFASLMMAVPGAKAEAQEKGIDAALKSIGIDLATMVDDSAGRAAAELKPKKLPSVSPNFDTDEPTGPMIQKQAEYNGIPIVNILQKISETSIGRQILSRAGFKSDESGSKAIKISSEDKDLESKFNNIPKFYVNKALENLKKPTEKATPAKPATHKKNIKKR